MDLHPVLAGRRSVRAFREEPVPESDVRALIEAAGWAPSSGNHQPWRFLSRSSAESRAELAPCLSRGNQWALKAPLLLILVTRLDWDTRSNGVDYAIYDAGLAAMSLTIEAEARGLRVHQMAGWLKEPLEQVLRLPAGVTPLVVMAVGYEGDPNSLDEPLRLKELRLRTRKSLSEIWSNEVWPEAWGTG